jgi:SAM-dependent methyltransferase
MLIEFYTDTLQELLDKELINRDMRILVLCGGNLDRDALLRLGFKNVTISNIDTRMTGTEYAPFAWSFQDAENLTLADGDYDFCIAHSGLHHCASPHRALLELYRVARTGVLIFEPRDNLLSRLGVLLNFAQEYEVLAVKDNGYTFGGVRNTAIPNYVYRWTEREIRKTVASFAPWVRHGFLFRYRLRVHWGRLWSLKNKVLLVLMALAYPFLKCLTLLCPGQCNNFAFAIFKPLIPDGLQPWIKMDDNGVNLDKAWVEKRYGSTVMH